MTNIVTQTLYEQDFALWVKDTVTKLKARNIEDLDWENLIDEVESLGKRDKRELMSRLTTLFEHALKRRYVPLPDCYRGWEATINRTQQELNRILRDSPSLQNYFQEVSEECYRNALKNMQKGYDANFPETCPFPLEVNFLLNEEFYLV